MFWRGQKFRISDLVERLKRNADGTQGDMSKSNFETMGKYRGYANTGHIYYFACPILDPIALKTMTASTLAIPCSC